MKIFNSNTVTQYEVDCILCQIDLRISFQFAPILFVPLPVYSPPSLIFFLLEVQNSLYFRSHSSVVVLGMDFRCTNSLEEYILIVKWQRN